MKRFIAFVSLSTALAIVTTSYAHQKLGQAARQAPSTASANVAHR